MEERDWQIIKTLYEQKNITKTARVLYMSQPTLTARIKQIEESLGTKLLYRGNKGITFTETGEYTVKFAEHILGEMQELRNYYQYAGRCCRNPAYCCSKYPCQIFFAKAAG